MKIARLLLLLSLAVACGQKKQSTSEEQAPATVVPEGWKSLFDGKSLAGWHIYKGQKNNTWEAKDGMLHCKANNVSVKGDGDDRSDILTDEQFENFELTCEWKITPEGNSGIMYRVTEEFDYPFYSGPEYQLIDDAGYPDKLKDSQHTGANYDMEAPAEAVAKPVGEWNTTRIVVNGNHVEHWLNGKQVVTYELHSDDWTKRKEGSKWKDVKGYGMSPKGSIDLQDHGHEIWFRNLLVKTP